MAERAICVKMSMCTCRERFPYGPDGVVRLDEIVCIAMTTRLGIALSLCAFVPPARITAASSRRGLLADLDEDVVGEYTYELKTPPEFQGNANGYATKIYEQIVAQPQALAVSGWTIP